MPLADIIFAVVLLGAMAGAWLAGKLTLAGTLTGGLLAVFIYAGAGYTGIAMMATFFVLSVLATSHGKHKKQDESAGHPQIRNAGQVLANGSVAALFGLLMQIVPDIAPVFAILMASALSSAMADTLSSELGMVYGRRFYNVLNLKPDERGRDGVISLEGTLLGVLGSICIATVYGLAFGFNKACMLIVIAGTIGNLTDSVLGATLERKDHLNNDAVNFINTITAALAAWILTLL